MVITAYKEKSHITYDLGENGKILFSPQQIESSDREAPVKCYTTHMKVNMKRGACAHIMQAEFPSGGEM